jgi:REP element-mobilizing transposase RayT
MTELFGNKYCIPSARAEWWDYGTNAAYFVTICTQNREHFFGRIASPPLTSPRLIPSLPGAIAQACWLEIPQYFPFVQLGAFVVMPNHVHGILVIAKPPLASLPPPATTAAAPPATAGGCAGDANPMLHDNLSRIVRWYKGRTSFEARKIWADFAWQPRFHDHIIRNASAYQNITNYIFTNPALWQEDQFHSLSK